MDGDHGQRWRAGARPLEVEFGEAMMNLYRKAKEECGYNATYFLNMLGNIGGVATAHKLLEDQTIHYGLARLWECGRLDLTVEYLVLDKRFESLFAEHELEEARRRLQEYGLDPAQGGATVRQAAKA